MKVGSLVECVVQLENWHPLHIQNNTQVPIKGEIYTVRWIGPGKHPGYEDQTFLLLEEVVNKEIKFLSFDPEEPMFAIEYFKEVQPPMKVSIEELMEEIIRS